MQENPTGIAENQIPKEDLPTVKSNKCLVIKHYIGMLIIGSLNNLPYWVALSSAQSIVYHFNSEGFLGAITWACVLLGMAATSINTLLSSKNVSYNIRSIVNGLFMGLGLIGTAFAPNIYVAILCIVFVGLSSDFGEGVMLGYFASIGDDSLMGAWGVGTGISGLLGSGYAFLAQLFSVDYFTSFIALSPAGLAYPLAFIFLLDANSTKKASHPKHVERIPDDPELPHSSKTKKIIPNKDGNVECDDLSSENGIDETKNLAELEVVPASIIKENEKASFKDIEELSESEDEDQNEKDVKCCSLKLWKYTFYFFINNGLTFFFQYVSISGFNDCSMTIQEKLDKPYIYSLLNLIYQAGNLVGRASLKWLKIKQLWLLTLIQGLFSLLWFFEVLFKFLPLWAKILSMVFIGLNSGFSYVNVFNQTMNYPIATPKEREIMTNLTTISIAGFIVVSSAFTLLFQNTFLKKQCTM
ncbi:CLN3 protein [Tritrichomonas foetus]|uniref:CLN3 protein n=1 Tax=Tritrichomonas foetus TaxID=1144522 RepID=A0A1J4JZJ0_9EUKA|nr:CLN3 protein [Tritrichomonas foetus]|eukprot:OHT04577.1 CLN3 protein [Tritrichomonas foetus]